MHYPSSTVLEAIEAAEPNDQGTREHFLVLDRGDSAWNPATTKGDIHGPATVQFIQYADGGLVTRQFPR